MTRLRILSLALTTFVVVAACGGDAPPPASPGRDIVLTPDTALVRGEVAEHSDARHHAARERPCRAGRDRGRGRCAGGLRSAAAPIVAAVRARADASTAALRHFEYEIDADSFLRVTPVSPGADDLRAEVLPIPKTARAAMSCRRRSTTRRRHSSRRWTRPERRAELTIALAQVFAGEIDFNTEVQPGDRFALAFERFVREERPTTYGAITAAEFHNDGRRDSRGPLHAARRRAGLLRRARAVAAAVLPAVAAEIRAADHVTVFVESHAPGAPDGAGAPRCRLRSPDGRPSRRGCRPAPWSRRLRQRERSDGSHSTRKRIRFVLPASVCVRARGSQRRAGRSGPDHRPGGFDRARHRPASPLRTAEERSVGRSPSGASQHAARRSGAGCGHGGLPRRQRTGAGGAGIGDGLACRSRLGCRRQNR